MNRTITFKGTPLTLVGRNIQEGVRAWNFSVADSELKKVTLNDFKDTVRVITSFPSIDTPVCDAQIKEFNERAVALSEDVCVVGISKDLPFAQKRFCQANNITHVSILSDYATSSFGIQYGLLIQELELLARSVIIVDRADTIRYIQLVGELTRAPDYDSALGALDAVLKNPTSEIKESLSAHCKPCEEGVGVLGKEHVEKLLAEHRGWELIDEGKLRKEFKCKDFIAAKHFFDAIAVVAEEQGHHPVVTVNYNSVRITLTTHAVGGLTENDFIMAKMIDALGG